MNSRLVQYLRRSSLTTNTGQIAVEYILLVAASVSIAALIVTSFASRNPEDPGLLTGKWRQIIEVIATDRIEN